MRKVIYLILIALFSLRFSSLAMAQNTLCAKVKVEIAQELTLERQAFLAKMLITNNLELSLDEVKVDVIFKDANDNLVNATSDPNDLTATFFITISALNGINNISSGTIAAGSAAEIQWLIIPASGAAANSPLGELYFVGATVNYKTNGTPTTVDIAPDNITVLPQSELHLDYFLPYDVYGDDPLTPQTEPIIPFTLGVRVKNEGLGDANNLKISSSQPKIVENLQGLLISFHIIGSFVNDNSVSPTLKLDFGNLESNTAKVGRWLMQTTLAGKFTEFSAKFVHSDTLGGALTSLVKEVNTHTLLKDVLVDLPGRDSVRDFLVKDPLTYRMFESEGIDNIVVDQSASVTMTSQGGGYYSVNVPPTAGMLYLQVPDPFQGQMAVQNVVRADGKKLPEGNAWFYQHGLGQQKQYFFSLFDVNGGGNYLVQLGTPQASGNQAPIIDPIADVTAKTGTLVKFQVHSFDPDNTIPLLSTDLLPIGATFTPNGKGAGEFSWLTKKGQEGSYPVTFKATDGQLTTNKTPIIKLIKASKPDPDPKDPTDYKVDLDHDGLWDDWEINYFGDTDQGSRDDFDGDGLVNIQEAKLGTDPTWAANAPSVPFINWPLYGKTVNKLKPTLRIESSKHGVDVPSYDFEIAPDLRFSKLVASNYGVKELAHETSWELATNLVDGKYYFWRARARLKVTTSNWVYGKFFVDSNAVITGPQTPKFPTPTPTPTGFPPHTQTTQFKLTVENPAEKGRVDSLNPKLVVLPTSGLIKYHFEIAADKDFRRKVQSGITSERFWSPPLALRNFKVYFWRVRGEYNNKKLTKWSKTNSLFVSKDPLNDPPRGLLVTPISTLIVKKDAPITFTWVATDSESNANSTLMVNGQPQSALDQAKPELGDNFVYKIEGITSVVGQSILELEISDGQSQVDAKNSCELTVIP